MHFYMTSNRRGLQHSVATERVLQQSEESKYQVETALEMWNSFT